MAIILGTDENETFKGYKGDNEYQGNRGNDTYRDYDGNDVYYYNLGDGNDTFQDSVGVDKLVFGEGISFEDLYFESYNNNIHVFEKQTGAMLNFVDWIRREDSKIETFEFADGFSLTKEDVDSILDGTYDYGDEPEPDIIQGTQENETFKGYIGNNNYQGNGGNDTYRDYSGDEVYYYNLGDGTDTIQDSVGTDKLLLGDDISFDDLYFSEYGNNLHIRNMSTGELINVVDWVRREDSKIETIEFADGFSLTKEDVDSILAGTYDYGANTPVQDYEVPTPTFEGTDVYDYIDNQSGDNIYYAKKGNDWIRDYGGSNDVYIYNKGDGQDTYKDWGGYDELVFTGGITKDDLLFFKYENNLQICLKNATDKVDFINGVESYYGLEKIHFEDGSSLNKNEIDELILDTNVQIGSSDSEPEYGTYEDDVIYAIQGDDVIFSYSGNDIVYGGSGNDTIYCESGNDTLMGNRGDDVLYGGHGDDSYCGYYAHENMGIDLIQDEGGTDTLHLEDYSTLDTQIQAIDSNEDGMLDSLQLNLINESMITLQFYFDNSSAEMASIGSGSGYIETLVFEDANVDLNNLQTFIV